MPNRARCLPAIMAALAVGMVMPIAAHANRRTRQWKWDKAIARECKRYMPPGWDWLIFKALVKQESRFDPNAVSYVGAAGLTQLMPATARELGMSPDERFVPALAINGGVRYLRKTWNVWGAEKDGEAGNWERTRFACGSYNAGVGNILKGQRQAKKMGWPTDQWASIDKALRQVHSHWRETTTYVRRIFGYYEEFKAERQPAAFRTKPTIGLRERKHWLAVRAREEQAAPSPAKPPAPRPALSPSRSAASSRGNTQTAPPPRQASPAGPATEQPRSNIRRGWLNAFAGVLLVVCIAGIAGVVLKRRRRNLL